MTKCEMLVAIAGPTCAYKTSVVDILKEKLEPTPTVFSFDEYDLYPAGSEAMERELQEPMITNWEDPALFDEEAYIKDLADLRKGSPIKLQTRSRESLRAGENERFVTPTQLMIVEGVFVYRDPRALGHIGLTVFMDLPMEEMVRRRLKAASRGGNGPWDDPDYITGPMVEGTQRYVMPQRDRADLVVDAMKSPQKLSDIVAVAIQSAINF